jgi:hypothetical protein
MNTRVVRLLFTAFLAIAALRVAAAPDQPGAPEEQAASLRKQLLAANDPWPAASQTRRTTFRQITGHSSLPLRSTEGSTILAFGGRADEMITRATLVLRYTYSPALIPSQSHIKVLLNDEIVGVAPFSKENAGRNTVHKMEIDPRFLADFNRLKLQLISHYASECEDPLNSSLWAEISGSSELELSVRPLSMNSDLADLPEPFFDRRDLKRLSLPFVFAAEPSTATLRAAGVVSSWFGQLARWRGARFPAGLDRPVRGHAVVFATNGERPAFLAGHSPVEGPTLRVITNPEDGYSKLLLVLGRDGNDLKLAADALVLGNAALSGTEARIRDVQAESPRQPYDAPNWVRPDRPTKFGELVDSPNDLQVFGHSPDLVRIKMRVPPDLFTWRSRGVPVDLKFRYTAPSARDVASSLTMSVNDELVRAFDLQTPGGGGETARVRLAVMDERLRGDRAEALIPAFALGSRNQLQFGFSFGVPKDGTCRSSVMQDVRGMIDPDSKVDFSGYPHYAAMPHLGFFAAVGFPFTRYADLSQTVVVLPEAPTAHDIGAFLTVMGRMGESTGHPATHVRVTGPSDEAGFRDADLLIIGTSPKQSLLDKWGEKLPAMVSGQMRRMSEPVRKATSLYEWLGFGTQPDPTVLAKAETESSGALAALIGFESPVSSKRSVVVLTAVAPEHLGIALDALEDSGLVRAMHGSSVFIHPNKVESFLTGKTYFVGDLPLWTAIWFHLSEHPVLLAITTVSASLVLAVLLWRVLRLAARRRLRGEA